MTSPLFVSRVSLCPRQETVSVWVTSPTLRFRLTATAWPRVPSEALMVEGWAGVAPHSTSTCRQATLKRMVCPAQEAGM